MIRGVLPQAIMHYLIFFFSKSNLFPKENLTNPVYQQL